MGVVSLEPKPTGHEPSLLAELMHRAVAVWGVPLAVPLAEQLYTRSQPAASAEALQTLLAASGFNLTPVPLAELTNATAPVFAWVDSQTPWLRMPDGTWYTHANTPAPAPALKSISQAYALSPCASQEEGTVPPIFSLWFRNTAPLGWFWAPFRGAGGLLSRLVGWELTIQLASACLPLFSLAVYDRVIPLGALQTLGLLGVGLALMMTMDLCLRILKSYGLGQLLALAARVQDEALLARLFKQRGAPEPARHMDILRTTQEAREQLVLHIFPHMAEIPTVILFLGLVAWVAPPLLPIPLGLIALNVALQFALFPMLTRAARRWTHAANRRMILLFELLHGNTHRRLANRQPEGLAHWQAAAGLLHTEESQGQIWQSLGTQLTVAMAQISYALVLVCGAYAVVQGSLTVGALVAASMLCSRALTPALQLTEMLGRLHKVQMDLQHVARLMASPEETLLPTAETPETLPNPQGACRLQQVGLHVPNTPAPLLHNLSLNIPAGARWAIVGSNGAGKSSLLNLLAGLHVPTSGTYLMDGIDTARLPTAALRQAIAYVPQAPTFPDVPLQEIIGGLAPLNPTALQQALDISGFGAVLQEKGIGLSYRAGPNAMLLSGGQRQLLALAAALYRMPRLLLLDEPTSALDPDAEQAFCSRLEPWLARTRTGLLMVTHRMPLLALTTHMAVLNKGELLFAGPKDDVLQRLKDPARAA